MLRTRWFKKASSVLCIICMLLSLFVIGGSVFAADEATVSRAEQNDVITNVEALLQDGSGPVGDITQWQVFRLKLNFELPNDTIHAGDTTVITLPDKLKFNQTASFEIKDSDGHVVAQATVNGSAKTLTLTYTEFAETHSDISGNFYFYVQIDRDKVDGEENIPLELDVSGQTIIGGNLHFVGIPDPVGYHVSKSGWQISSENNRTLRYQLRVNTVRESIQNVTVTDKISSTGFTYNHDSIVIYKGTWVTSHGEFSLQNETNVTADYNVIWNDDGSFTINLGDITPEDGFLIRYTATADYDLADGEIIQNDVVIRGDNIRPHTAHSDTPYYEAGGSAEGYVYTINIHKVSEDGSSLEGAVFNVIRVANHSVVGELVTDSLGNASITGLLKGEYQLVETSAPDGFTLLEDPIVVLPSDFGADKAVLVRITNSVEKIDIPVSKTWVGPAADSVMVNLLAGGTKIAEAELNEANNWQYTFTDLDKYDNGVEIEYSIEEVKVENYTSEITGDAQSGFIIINTEEPTTPPEEPTTPPEEPTTPSEEPTTPQEEPTTPQEEPTTPQEEPTTLQEEPTTLQEESTTSEKPATPPEKPGNPPSSPKTGDKNNSLLYFLIMLISGIEIAFIGWAFKRLKSK